MNTPIFRHFWILFMIVTLVNAFMLKMRSKQYIMEKPERATGYDTMFKWMIVLGTVIWIPLAVGMELDAVRGITLFTPDGGINPFILATMIALGVIDLLGFRWIFLNGGAAFLLDHPGLGRTPFPSTGAVKFFYWLAVLAHIGAVVVMYAMRNRIH